VRIGLFTPNYPGITGEGGIGTYTRQMAHALAARGHAVHVLAPGPEAREVPDGPVTVHLVRAHHLPVLDRFVPGAGACVRVWRAARRLVKRHGVEVFEFPNWEGFGVLFNRFRRVPVVVRLHTSSREAQLIDGTGHTRAARWDVWRERKLARAADALVTHSAAHASLMAEELGVDATEIRLIPHGIAPAPALTREPATGDELTVLFLGRMEKRKGTIDLLRAIPHVLREVPNARFVLIGSDRPHCPGGRTHAEFVRDDLPTAAQARVSLLGRLSDDDVNRWFRRADVFAAPSLYESFGLIFLEAMRWGVPVIGTTAGGIPEVVEHEKSGVLVPPSDPAALGAALVALLKNPVRRRILGAAGRARAESQFTTEHMARRAEALYAEAVARSGARRAGPKPERSLPVRNA